MELENPFQTFLVRPLVESFPNLELRGSLTSETDFLLHNINGEARSRGFDFRGDNPTISRSEQIFELKYKYHLAKGMSLGGQLDFLYEASFALDGGADRRPRKAQNNFEYFRSFKRWFREFFLEVHRGNWDFVVGKQQLVWGRIDTVRMMDQIQPRDIREFHDDATDDWEFTRQPTWMAVVRYWPLGETLGLEFLFKPDFEPDYVAPAGWLQSMRTIYPLPRSVRILDIDRPEDTDPSDWEYGFLTTLLIGSWDMGLSYYYAWDKSPTSFTRRITGSPGRPLSLVEQKHTRLHKLGSYVNFSPSIGGKEWTFRWESVLDVNKYLPTRAESRSRTNAFRRTGRDTLSGYDGVTKRNQLQFSLNADTALNIARTTDWSLTLQYLGTYTFGHDNDLFGRSSGAIEKWWHAASWSISKPFSGRRGMFSTGLTWIHDGNFGSRTKVSWDLTDYLTLSAAVRWFSGKDDDTYGVLEEIGDEIETEISYSF
ncbi:MAG: hypothetical protein HYS70_01375 [Nitrospinae bacterium]|nr:hypothetical protein [Nitrospinota bacterium]